MKKTIHLLYMHCNRSEMGCAPRKRGEITVTVTPSPCMLTPDSANRVQMDMLFRVPRSDFSKRSRLIIAPQLLANDSLYAEYLPMVMDAPIYEKKKHRLVQLEGYADPYAGQVRCRKSSFGYDCLTLSSCNCPKR